MRVKWMSRSIAIIIVLLFMFPILAFAGGGGGGGGGGPTNFPHSPSFSSATEFRWSDSSGRGNIGDALRYVTNLGSTYDYDTETYFGSCGNVNLTFDFRACGDSFSLRLTTPGGQTIREIGPGGNDIDIEVEPGVYRVRMSSFGSGPGNNGCHEYSIRSDDFAGARTFKQLSQSSAIPIVHMDQRRDVVEAVMAEECAEELCTIDPLHPSCDADLFESTCLARTGGTGDFWEAAVGNACCGDEADDTGRVHGDHLCGIVGFENGRSLRRWVDATETGVRGDVLRINTRGLGDAPYQAVSNGNEWITCGAQQSLNFVDVGSQEKIFSGNLNFVHGYYCHIDERGHFGFAECLGESTSGLNQFAYGGRFNSGEYTPFAMTIEGDSDNVTVDNGGNSGARILQHRTVGTERATGDQSLSLIVGVEDAGNVNALPARLILNDLSGLDVSTFTTMLVPFRYDRYAPVDLEFVLEDNSTVVISDIVSFSTQPPQKNVWHLLKIPLVDIGFSPIARASLVFDHSKSQFEEGFTYSFFIDSIALDRDIGDGIVYCSEYVNTDENGRIYREWFDDVDVDERFDKTKLACENSFFGSWTGSRCCGDDSDPLTGDEYFTGKEFYSDNEAGCWAGQPVVSGAPLQVYDVDFTIGSNIVESVYDCSDASCVRHLPDMDRLTDAILVDNQDVGFVFADVVSNSTDNYQSEIVLERSTPQIGFANTSFLGCYFDGSIVRATDDSGRRTTNNALQQSVVYSNTGDQCVISGNFYCDPKGFWNNQAPEGFSVSDLTHVSFVFNDSQNGGCCPSGGCWDGDQCVLNQVNDSSSLPLGGDGTFGFRCIDGDWTESSLKFRFDGSQQGFCPRQDHCFVGHNLGFNSSAGSNCVESGTFVGDYICEAGDWSTKTQKLAGHLLDISEPHEQYSLFCDHFENTLNYLGVINSRRVSDVLRGIEPLGGGALDFACANPANSAQECVNNFCVLRYDTDRVMFGTSLNVDDVSALSDVVDITCPDGDGFVTCSDSDYLFNHEFNILVFDPGSESFLGLEILANIIIPIIDFFRGIVGLDDDVPALERPDLSGVVETTQFNKLYFAKSAGKEVIGVRELTLDVESGQPVEFATFTYSGFPSGTEICRIIDEVKVQEPSLASISCVGDGPSRVVVKSLAGNEHFDRIWIDMSAAMRLDGR